MNGNRESRGLLLIYAATVFVSAFLVFQVQPLISRMILPWFGGTPAVWTTCMLFFQSVLFLGYAYAHVAHGKLTPKWQALAHFVLLVAALLLAYIAPSAAWKPHDASNPIFRILLLLAACVGLPYFVLATTGPLLQAWFARMFAGRSPYRLYALSNVGSLLALLSYPFVFEPLWGLNQQTWMWFGGFGLFVALCGTVAFHLWRSAPTMVDSGSQSRETSDAPESASSRTLTSSATDDGASPDHVAAEPKWFHWILWLALPAFGSFMLLATTNQVCIDVVPVPFLWVVPLSIYLLTFIIAFDHPRWYRPLVFGMATIVSLYAVAAVYYLGFRKFDLIEIGNLGSYLDKMLTDFQVLVGSGKTPGSSSHAFKITFFAALAFYFTALFMVCMLCHGQLARLRPAPRHLTAYYLMISAGGALGGMLVSLVAPLVFKTYLEWKLGIFASFGLAILVTMASWPSSKRLGPQILRFAVLLLMLGALYESVQFLEMGGSKNLEAVRNFYGTVSIREDKNAKPELHGYLMFNGQIIHGFQFSDPKKRSEPTTYYTRRSGVGRTLEALQQRKADIRVGAVGLGVGTLAAYAKPKSKFCFYEINPVAEQFARDTRYFTYLSEHPNEVSVVQGDARLTLERQKPQHLDLLVLDAFSGDAIPTHLLTREAFELYRGHLATREADGLDGSLAIHVTNKYFDLRPVVLAGAEQLGMECLMIATRGADEDASYRAHWMILSKDKKLLDALRPFVNDSEEPAGFEVFTEKDRNQDDQLGLAEWQQGVKAKEQKSNEELFRKIDSDGDGSVTRPEFIKWLIKPKVWTDDHSDPFKLLIR